MELAPDVTPQDIQVFLQEADEQLRLLDEDFVRLESESDSAPLLQEIFRAAHTLKGSSAMLGYRAMTDLAHHMEHVLDRLRIGALDVGPAVVDALLKGLDALCGLRDELARPTGRDVVTGGALEALAGIAEGGWPVLPTTQDQSPSVPLLRVGVDASVRARLVQVLAAGGVAYHVNVTFTGGTEWAAVRSFQLLQLLSGVGQVVASTPTQAEVEDGGGDGAIAVLLVTDRELDALQEAVATAQGVASAVTEPFLGMPETAPAAQPTGVSPPGAQEAAGAGGSGDQHAPRKAATAGQTVRIDVERLDHLMNTLGELVIDRTRIQQIGRVLEGRYKGDEMVAALALTSAHIVKVVDELQENTRKVRMQAIGSVFNGLPRLVRDLARQMDRRLDFIVDGAETEVDRTVIEHIRDPLIHLLRNAVDHGIEPPEERRAAGKPETARLRLSAGHEQGHIVIRVEDDGRGIDAEKVKAAAVRKGLVSAEAAARLSEAEAVDLIFLSGASTKERATEVSGRGVGMDIVRANIEAINGFVHVDTTLGQGTRFTLRLPLTLATVQALLVRSAGTPYAVPLMYVVETVRRAPAEIHRVGTAEVVRLRGAVVPLLRLNAVFGRGGPRDRSAADVYVVVVRLGERLVGIGVDLLVGTQDIVVKPLGRFVGDIRGIAGASVLGDGQVVLIVDVPTLAGSAIGRGPATPSPAVGTASAA